jgi:hypothetical protein
MKNFRNQMPNTKEIPKFQGEKGREKVLGFSVVGFLWRLKIGVWIFLAGGEAA